MGKKDQRIAKEALKVQKRSVRIAKYALFLAVAGVLIMLFKPQTIHVTFDVRRVLDSIPMSADSVQLSYVPVDFDAVKTIVRDSLDKGNPIDAWDLIRIGNVLYVQGKGPEAKSYYRVAWHQGEQANDSLLMGAAISNIGLIYSDKGDLDAALKYLQDALEIHREVGYRQGEANQLGNIGLIYYDKGDLGAALKYHNDALVIYREVGYRQGEANALGNIGLIYSDKGDLDAALKYLQEALVIHREVGYRQGEASDLGNLGNIAILKGDLDVALRFLKQVLEIFEQIGMPREVEKAKRIIAEIEAEQNDGDSTP